MVEPFYTPDLGDWIDSKVGEGLFRRLAARMDALRERRDGGALEDDPEDPLALALGTDDLRGLLIPDGDVDRILTYYVSKDGRRLNYLTQFNVPAGRLDLTAAREEIDEARRVMERAVQAGDVLDNL